MSTIMFVGFLLVLAILVWINFDIFYCLKRKKIKEQNPLDFFKVTETDKQFIIEGSYAGFPVDSVVVSTKNGLIRLFARVKVNHERGVESWESIEKECKIPKNASGHVNVKTTKTEVKVTIEKK